MTRLRRTLPALWAATCFAGAHAADPASTQATGGPGFVSIALLSLVALLGLALCVSTLLKPWFVRARASSAGLLLAAPLAGAVLALAGTERALGHPVSRTLGADPRGWLPSLLFGLGVVTVGMTIAMAIRLAGPRGRQARAAGLAPWWGSLQRGLALTWLATVPLGWAWDHQTAHHQPLEASARDLRAPQLRPLTPDEADARLTAAQPVAGSCELRIRRTDSAAPDASVGLEGPFALASYGENVAHTGQSDWSFDTWRDRSALLLGLRSGELAMGDLAKGSGQGRADVHRDGLDWRISLDDLWPAEYWRRHRELQREQAERGQHIREREAGLNAMRERQAHAPAIAADLPVQAQTPLSIEADRRSVVNAESLDVLRQLGLSCHLGPDGALAGCTDAATAQTCTLGGLEGLCKPDTEAIDTDVFALHPHDPQLRLRVEPAWYLLRGRNTAASPGAHARCVLLRGEVLDAPARVSLGTARISCGRAPTVVADLPFDASWLAALEGWRTLPERMRIEQAWLDDARRLQTQPAYRALPHRLNVVTRRELACATQPAETCRRFEAELASDGSRVDVEERCSDASTARRYSKFREPFFR